MDNKKIYLLFLAVVLCLISFSAVSAQEINSSSDIISQDISQDDTVGAFRGYTSFSELSTLINSANESDTIVLDKDYIYHDGDEKYMGGIGISKMITIDGNNHTIDASNSARFFTVSGSNVVLTNINFINGAYYDSYYYSESYSPIYWTGSYGIISNCQFKNCDGEIYDIIYWDGNAAKINNCSFIENSGNNVLNLNSYYGTVSNSNFMNNHATSIEVNSQNCDILNSNFINNTKQSIESNGDDTKVKYCKFINNTVFENGAAIYWTGARGILEHSSFMNNSNKNNLGGAVYFSNSNVQVDNCTFSNNSALRGGAIYFGYDSYNNAVSNSYFKENNAKYGGAIYWNSQNGRITKSKFENNFAMENGVIFWNQPDGKIDDSEFSNNWVKWYGGVIYINSNNITIDNNKFKNNSANLGSSIYLTNNKDLVVKYCNFENEEYSIYNKGNLNLTENKESKVNDGCILENYGTVNLKGNSFKNPIFNKGIITSQTYLSVLNNKTVDVLNATHVKLTATVYDDNKNSIVGSTFMFYELDTTYPDYDYIAVGEGIFSKGVYSFENYLVADSICPTSHFIYGRYSDSGISGMINESGTIVSKLSPNLKVSVKDIFVTEDVTISASVDFRATGKIVFNVNNKDYSVNIVNGKASKVISGLNPGTYNVKTTYVGDSKYIKTSKTVSFKVMGKPSSINVSASNIEVGQNANIIVNLPSDATGSVVINVNNKDYTANVSNGVAKTSVSGLLSGKYKVTAKYSGDNIFEPASNTTVFSVNKVTKYNMVAKADEITEGEDLIVIVTLPSDTTKNVTLMFDGSIYSNKTVNGVSRFVIKGLLSGEYDFSAIYDGDSKYASKTYNSKVIVLKQAVPILTAPELVKYFSGSENFNVYLTDSYNKTLGNENISIKVNGKTNMVTTNKNGLATLPVNLNAGSYNVVVSYDGGLYYNATSINSKITIKETINADNVTKIYGNNTQYHAKFLDSKGNVLVNKNITVNLNGRNYYRITDSNGEIIFKINLMQGKYPITVTNPVSKEKRTTYVTVLPSIIENKDVIMFYRNGSKYTVRLVGLDGKIVGKGAKVTFNINGVFYNRTTDENGYARLNINLNPKSYVITAEYNGCKVSNTIVVKPILTASDLIKKYGGSEPFKVKLVDGKGKELAGETVTFNINGVMYNRITDNSGMAKLNINLMPGKYIITSSYSNGATISNTITINK